MNQAIEVVTHEQLQQVLGDKPVQVKGKRPLKPFELLDRKKTGVSLLATRQLLGMKQGDVAYLMEVPIQAVVQLEKGLSKTYFHRAVKLYSLCLGMDEVELLSLLLVLNHFQDKGGKQPWKQFLLEHRKIQK